MFRYLRFFLFFINLFLFLRISCIRIASLKQDQLSIAASLMAGDLARIGQEAHDLAYAGIDEFHIDVMDNHFVPNLGLSPDICKSLRKFGINKPMDIHLMANPVDSLIQNFANAGANSISFHLKSMDNIKEKFKLIESYGLRKGLVLNPFDEPYLLENYLEYLDFIVIMGVNPGFSGQTFLNSTYEKIEKVHSLVRDSKLNIGIKVDGGLNLNNILNLKRLGANSFIFGSFIFSCSKNKRSYRKLLESIRNKLA